MPSYKSNAKKIIGKIAQKFNRLRKVEVDKLARVAAFTLQGNIANRVFQDGQASNESNIGKYSTRPLPVFTSSFIKKSVAKSVLGPRSKKIEWITTRSGRRIPLLKGGYKELRRLQGRKVDKVNLNYTGKLLSDWSIAGRKNQYVLGFRSEYGKEISNRMEAKYRKPIFNSTTKERKEIVGIFENGINVVLK